MMNPARRGSFLIGAPAAAVLFVRTMRMQRQRNEIVTNPGIHPIETQDGLEVILRADLAVLFKHSTTCPLSFHALREMQQFVEDHPGVAMHLINVHEQRALSNHAAQALEIRHESPQVIVIRDGSPAWTVSHEQVTAENLARHVGG